MDDLGVFLVLAADIHTDLDMAALDLVVKGLADIMQQTGTAGQRDVHAHLACQQTGQPGHLHAVGQSVLAKAGAVLQAADELDEVGVQAVDAKLHHGALALPLHLQLKVVAALLHRLLNAGGVDAAITDQALQRHAGNLAAGLVKGGQGDGLRGIIDDKIHAGGSFQRADVAALTADDTALHLVAGQGHHADGGLAAVVSGAAADGLTDHVAGDVIAVFLQVGLVGSHTDSLLVGELLVHLVQQHFAGILLAQARQGLQRSISLARMASTSAKRLSASSCFFLSSSSFFSRASVLRSSAFSFWSMRFSWRLISARRCLISLSASASGHRPRLSGGRPRPWLPEQLLFVFGQRS